MRRQNWEHASNEDRQAFARSVVSDIVFDLDTQQITGFKLRTWIEPHLQVRAGIVSSDVLQERSSVQAVRWLSPQDAESLLLRCTQEKRSARKIMPYNHRTEAERNGEIMLRYQGGESTGNLALAFGVSDRRVRAILARERRA